MHSVVGILFALLPLKRSAGGPETTADIVDAHQEPIHYADDIHLYGVIGRQLMFACRAHSARGRPTRSRFMRRGDEKEVKAMLQGRTQ